MHCSDQTKESEQHYPQSTLLYHLHTQAERLLKLSGHLLGPTQPPQHPQDDWCQLTRLLLLSPSSTASRKTAPAGSSGYVRSQYCCFCTAPAESSELTRACAGYSPVQPGPQAADRWRPSWKANPALRSMHLKVSLREKALNVIGQLQQQVPYQTFLLYSVLSHTICSDSQQIR